MDSDMKELLRMDARMTVMDRVITAVERFEAYVHELQLESILRSEGSWRHGYTRSVTSFRIQGIYPFSFRERVKPRLKWSERDDTDRENVRKATPRIAMMIEEEEGNRAIDEEVDRRRNWKCAKKGEEAEPTAG